MPLATKNGSLVVKNGSVAQDCNCCSPVGWYCCESPECAIQRLSSVSVELSAVGYMLQRHYHWQCVSYVGESVYREYYLSAGFDGPSLTGVHFLQKQSSGAWSTSISSPGGCKTKVTLTPSGSTSLLLNIEVPMPAWQITDQESYRSLSQLSCGDSVSGAWQSAGDTATFTRVSTKSILIEYAASSGRCFDIGAAASVLPQTLAVNVPNFLHPSCDQIASDGVVSTNLETGSQIVTIKAITLTQTT